MYNAGAHLAGDALDARLPYLISCLMTLMVGYKTQALNMLITKKTDDYFQRKSEQTAKKKIDWIEEF